MHYFLYPQDLCQLVNADNPLWLTGITEMTRTFGLELLESVMSGYPRIFLEVRKIFVTKSNHLGNFVKYYALGSKTVTASSFQ